MPTIFLRAIGPFVSALLCIFVLCELANAEDKGRWPKLEQKRWSGTINVPDPVAVSVDNRGRVFITQTQRRKLQDLDIRKNKNWIPDDLSFRTIDDKRKFFHEQLAIGGNDDEQRRHVEDVNQDGHHDWRDLTVISEKIYRLVDNDSDGTADEITTFADNFQTEITGIAAGVLAHDGEIWATIAPDVWKLHDSDDDGVADSRTVMATGFGLHIAYAGHDMHGLTVGPDGKIYWSIGDKGIDVTTKDGRHFAFPNQGGVMRCNPDGSDFEVFAHGLRNVQEFAFDKFGNIFGVDNDADQPGERERFVAIVDGMDAGWRCNYQYRGDRFNPWTHEKLWQLAAEDHPAYLVPPIDHYMDGPAGFKYNPGTALSPEYRDFFFVTNAPKGHYYAFRTERSGDSFRMVDAHEVGSGHALIGLAFGPDGGLYGADWDGGYPLDQKGAVIRLDVDGADRSPIRMETKSLLAEGFSSRSAEELARLISHPDMRVRMGAQFEFVKQGDSTPLASMLAEDNRDVYGRLHCVWGLGQLARLGDGTATKALIRALQIDHWAVQAQAVKTLGESPLDEPGVLLESLTHADLQVRVNAGLALARHPTAHAVPILLKQTDVLESDQHYLRHSIVRALASCATADELAKQHSHGTEMRRLVCVVALRQIKSPRVAEFLTDTSNWVATEASRAIHDDESIEPALDALAESLDDAKRNEFYLRRAINANFRIGTNECATRLLRYASDSSKTEAARVEACEALGQWLNPLKLDRVDGRRRILPNELRSFDRAEMERELTRLVLAADSSPGLRATAVSTARQLNIALSKAAMTELLFSKKTPMPTRIEALKSIGHSETDDVRDDLVKASELQSGELSARAIELLVQRFPDQALSVIHERLRNSNSLRTKKACIVGLANLARPEADEILLKLGETLTKAKSRETSLEVVTAVRSRSRESGPLKQLAKRIDALQSTIADELKLGEAAKASRFAFSATGGNRGNGKRIFTTHLQAQCARCHRIGKSGSDIGPDLTKIGGQRDAQSLLRSIVNPSDEIEPKYFTQTIILDDGKIVRGAIKSRDDERVVLVNDEGEEITIATDEVDEIIQRKTSLMPDMTDALTPAEVRDLVAYLGSLK